MCIRDRIKTAAERGADVLVSGDLKYHDIRLAQAVGLALVDAGHDNTEYPIIPWPVSYTHLDVYKRQGPDCLSVEIRCWCPILRIRFRGVKGL